MSCCSDTTGKSVRGFGSGKHSIRPRFADEREMARRHYFTPPFAAKRTVGIICRVRMPTRAAGAWPADVGRRRQAACRLLLCTCGQCCISLAAAAALESTCTCVEGSTARSMCCALTSSSGSLCITVMPGLRLDAQVVEGRGQAASLRHALFLHTASSAATPASAPVLTCGQSSMHLGPCLRRLIFVDLLPGNA